jgi:hypothetical protein
MDWRKERKNPFRISGVRPRSDSSTSRTRVIYNTCHMTEAIKDSGYCAVTPFCWGKYVMRNTLHEFLSLVFLQNFSRWEVDARKIFIFRDHSGQVSTFYKLIAISYSSSKWTYPNFTKDLPPLHLTSFFSSRRFVTLFFASINWQGNGPIRHIETCPDFFHCKNTHNKIHCQNSSC